MKCNAKTKQYLYIYIIITEQCYTILYQGTQQIFLPYDILKKYV